MHLGLDGVGDVGDLHRVEPLAGVVVEDGHHVDRRPDLAAGPVQVGADPSDRLVLADAALTGDLGGLGPLVGMGELPPAAPDDGLGLQPDHRRERLVHPQDPPIGRHHLLADAGAFEAPLEQPRPVPGVVEVVAEAAQPDELLQDLRQLPQLAELVDRQTAGDAVRHAQGADAAMCLVGDGKAGVEAHPRFVGDERVAGEAGIGPGVRHDERSERPLDGMTAERDLPRRLAQGDAARRLEPLPVAVDQ